MNKDVFPFGNGVGIFENQKLCICIIDENGNKKIGGNITKKKKKFFSFPFLRGFFYFFYEFYLYFQTIKKRREIENFKKEKTKKYRITKKISITSDLIFLFSGIILAFIIGLVGLTFLPNFIFKNIFLTPMNQYLKNFIIATIKVIIIFFIFAILKIAPFMTGLYRFNGAGCKYLSVKNKKTTLIWQSYPLNFLNFLLNVGVFSTFVVSLIAINIFWVVDTLINIAIFFVCASIVYEFLYLTTNSKLVWLKDIALLTNFFVCSKPKITQNEVLTVIKNEIKNFDNFENVENYMVPMSVVCAEMETKLSAQDKYEQSDVDWIIANVLNKNRAETKLVRFVSQKDYREIMRCCDRKAKGEPLSNIFGFVEFYGLRFDVNKKVLSPRMETEILVEEVIKKIKEHAFEDILDLCTGSGAIGISIAKFTNCKVTASDISKQALSVAESNARKNGVKIDFIHSDLFKNLKKNKRYDIIVSNPPYIKSKEIEKLDAEVKNYDPKLALDGGEDGLNFYRIILKEGTMKLNKGGYIFVEIGNEQREDVEKLFKNNGFVDIQVVKDYNKIERIVYGRKRT